MFQIETYCDRLPEDIEKMKWAGDFAAAHKRIDYLLSQDIPARLKARLELEKGRIDNIEASYPYTRAEALATIRRDVPDFADEELDALDLEGKTDFIYVGGRRMYFADFWDTILKVNAAMRARAGREDGSAPSYTDLAIEEMKKNGEMSVRMRIKATLRVKDGAFVPGKTYTVHIPIPAACHQNHDIELLSFSHEPLYVSPEDAPQRTVCFRETLSENTDFFVEYVYIVTNRYWDGVSRERVYAYEAPVTEADLAEEQPHITFSPYMRALEKELSQGASDDIEAARRFYDYITTHVKYSYVRDYADIDQGAEYAAINLKGDCGLQALMFITLCRLHGIPARWQSGLWADPSGAGSHDWAQFYIEGAGWLFCDPSYGGGAYRSGKEERRRFYFGNLDPYRMVANRAYGKPFEPDKKFMRNDPFDSQSGEVETEDRAILSSERRVHRTVTVE